MVSSLSRNEVTQVLLDWKGDESRAAERLMPLVYDELRRLAAGYLRRERSDHTLQATGLVHEAYLRLVDQQNLTWRDRAHFFAVCAQVMRRILVDHARNHRRAKRGAGREKLELNEALVPAEERTVDLLALDEAMRDLTTFDLQKSRIVELRFFGGLTTGEISEVLSISERTIRREWRIAKAWLRRRVMEEAV